MNAPASPVGRGRAQFLLLAALFFAPLLLAILFYFGLPSLQPEGKTNYGQLVNPAQPLPEFRWTDLDGAAKDLAVLRGRWSYIYLAGEDCDTACMQKLYQIRQIRLLLNEKRLRVQRVYLAPNLAAAVAAKSKLAETHPDLLFLALDGGSEPATSFFRASDPEALYLTDPLANWLMVYPAESDSPGILKDIKKLLRLSQIG
jgi:hypothetical protein